MNSDGFELNRIREDIILTRSGLSMQRLVRARRRALPLFGGLMFRNHDVF
jgi:hypothetical protein